MAPEGWTTRTLDDIANVVSGVAFPRVHQGSPTGSVPFFKVSDMNATGNERDLCVAANTIDMALLKSLKGKLHPAGTVVFPKVGAALLTNKRRRLLTPSCFDNNVMGLVATNCHADYLYLLMQTIDFGKYVQPGAVPSINGSTVRGIQVLIPSIPEQRRIAAIVSSVDKAIEKTQTLVGQVKAVKRWLVHEMFARGLPRQHRCFKRTEMGEVPETWDVRPLIEACTQGPLYGANVAKSSFLPGGIRYIRISDIGRDGSLVEAAVGISECDAEGYMLSVGDIVFARTGATVGKTYLHRDAAVRAAFAGYLIRFRTNHDVLLPEFLREYVETRTYWRWVADRQRVQAQPNINATEYSQLPVPCPPMDEQRRIVEIAESFNSCLRLARRDMRAKHYLKQALMSVLLTGELRVTPDPEDE